MQPKDIDFRPKNFTLGLITEMLDKDMLDYEVEGNTNASIIESVICQCKLDSIILREDPNKKQKSVSEFFLHCYKIYRGHGLLRTIKKYILDEEPFEGLVILTEYNGKKFNDLPIYLQRRFKEGFIVLYIDESIDYQYDKTDIIENYMKVIEYMR